MKRKRNFLVGGTFVVLLVALGAGQAMMERAAAQQRNSSNIQAPRFEVDPFWPKPLPNHWILGNNIGVWADEQDVIWTINRSGDSLAPQEKALDLKNGECCAGAPPVLGYDAGGNRRAALGRRGAGLRLA